MFDSGTWPADIAQLLDDHHLVVLSDKPDARSRFCQVFCDYLLSLIDTCVVTIDGARVTDMRKFCDQIRRHLPRGRAVESSIQGVVDVLRQWPNAPKRMYFLWHDADVALDADVKLFSRLVNALCSVAVEHEHINPHRLILQRSVFVGNSKLGAYVEDQRGQFSRWLVDNETLCGDEEESMFWEAQSCIDRPPVLTYRIDG